MRDYPAQVQGILRRRKLRPGCGISTKYAGDESRSVEVIIVGRGGGSAEDLAAFNDEGLARRWLGRRFR